MSNIIHLNRKTKLLKVTESGSTVKCLAQNAGRDVDNLFLAFGAVLSIGLPLLTCYLFTDLLVFITVGGAQLAGAGIGVFNYYRTSRVDNRLVTGASGPPAVAKDAIEKATFKRAA